MIKKLIAHLTKPVGLFYDGYQFLVECNNPENYVVERDFETDNLIIEFYEHRYEKYKQNRFGWWINTGNVVYSTTDLQKEG